MCLLFFLFDVMCSWSFVTNPLRLVISVDSVQFISCALILCAVVGMAGCCATYLRITLFIEFAVFQDLGS